MNTPGEWIAFAMLCVVALGSGLGGAIGVGKWISWRLTGLGDKVDDATRNLDIKIESVKGSLQIQLDGIKDKGQERHEELLQRMTRVETVVGARHRVRA